jgi:3',5'-cyclic AMP phosphodiesterase CpdA
MDRRPITVFFALLAGFSLLATLGVPSAAHAIGDTLTVVQRPLLNIPVIVVAGGTFTIECEAASGATGWAAELIHGQKTVTLSISSSTYNSSTLWWEIEATVPAVPVYELYDLEVTANGGIYDVTKNAVHVIPAYKDDYYFIHITDTHLPTHLYYYEPGSDTDSSEVVDFREIIHDVNIINPEFVLITGDFINEGELEEFLNKQYYTRCQALLHEFDVPVYLSSGNHDIGGWDDSPPPDGTARRDWWRFFGWKRLDSPPTGAPWYTQNYSFDYGPVHYIGLEAYINYDGWRTATYGGESFTSGQMQWLDDEMAASAGSAAHVLFYHRDFSNQINLNGLGADMALSGHTHSDNDDFSHPYDIVTDNVCDGARSYRLIRVSGGTLQPTYTIDAGSGGTRLDVSYSPANNGTNYSVTADIDNNHSERFQHSRLRFIMPNEPGTVEVTGGTLLQIDDSGTYAVYYVAVDISASSAQSVTVTLEPGAGEPPTVTVDSPDGGEAWDIGLIYDITWTADDDVGVVGVDILLSTDGGASFPHTVATGEANDGTYSWQVDVVPTTEARVKVVAWDGDMLSGEDVSGADFEIYDPTSGVDRDRDIPAHAVISGNMPNPFNASTVIRFGIPADGPVDLGVYDVSGRLVSRVTGGRYEAGYHEVGWTNAETARPGVYFLRLRTGSAEATRKIVISR